MPALALDVQRIHTLGMAKTAPKKKASGRNIADSERNTNKLTLRLDPDIDNDLHEYAAEFGMPISRVVEVAMGLLFRGRVAVDSEDDTEEGDFYLRFRDELAAMARGESTLLAEDLEEGTPKPGEGGT